MKAAKSTSKPEAGIALLTTLLLLLMMTSLMVGFILMVVGGTRLAGLNDDYSKAYYASEAGMEKLTADLGTLFDANYSPTSAEINNITLSPPTINGVQYINAQTGGNGYAITPSAFDANGNPKATLDVVNSGPYTGLNALATTYTLQVTSHTSVGSEAKLQRTVQTVGIPMFQFGVFSDTDLSFFPGPKFSFGGRTHTNGNLFLAAGTELDMLDHVTAVGDVIRPYLSNGFADSSNYGGPVNIAKAGGSSPPLRTLQITENSLVDQGSLSGTLSAKVPNSNWPNISLGSGNYNGYLRAGTTGPKTKLNLGVVTLGQGITQSIDVLRRPPGPENISVTGERYFAQASMHILLSDNPQDIMNLPCIDPTTQPFNLADISGPPPPAVPGNWASTNAQALLTAMNNNLAAGLNTPPIGLAQSGAGGLSYSSADGYWSPAGTPLIKGYIKIEVQKNYGTPCGGWKDVTIEVLALGYTGKDINPIVPGGALLAAPSLNALPNLIANPNGQLSQVDNPAVLEGNVPTECYQQDPHPNALIRLQRIRDNPSNENTKANGVSVPPCGVIFSGGLIQTWPTAASDYWPNALFDTREGELRDTAPSNNTFNGVAYNQMVTLGGVMQYIEVDANNIARYFNKQIGSSGNLAFDPSTAPNDFSVYISDRRNNYTASQAWVGAWPPLSPSLHETGEYGNTDVVNAVTNPLVGCPNGATETGEDYDQTGQGYFYGEDPTQALKDYNAVSPWTGGNGYFKNITTAVGPFVTNPFCTSPAVPNAQLWPGTFVVRSNEARENVNPFFRRAIKIVHGSSLNLGICPGSTTNTSIPCGLTIATENPAYIQGDFNANSQGNGWNDPHVATSVSADAVTFLSDNWNDYNSFLFPYQIAQAASSSPTAPGPVGPGSLGKRGAVTTYYRVAIAAGKNVSFPQPSGTAQDFGTDGGVHNFLRYIENWGGSTLNYKGSLISIFYSRQAVGVFKCCTTVYSPPSRGYNFDVEFLTPQLLPPRTPLFRDVNTTGFTQMLLPNQ